MFGAAALTGGRGDINYLASACFNQVRNCRLGAQICAGYLDVHDALEDFLWQIEDGHAVGAAGVGGVVDEYIKPAELFNGSVYHHLYIVGTGDIDRERERARALLADLVCGAFDVAPARLPSHREGSGLGCVRCR